MTTRMEEALNVARIEEREAMAAYVAAAKRNGCGVELYRLANDWRAARDELGQLEASAVLEKVAPAHDAECATCRRPFSATVPMARVNAQSKRAACAECAPYIDLIRTDRARAEVAA